MVQYKAEQPIDRQRRDRQDWLAGSISRRKKLGWEKKREKPGVCQSGRCQTDLE